MPGVKHLINCHCILAIFKNNQKIINHRFPVYSKVDETGKPFEKIVKCNNCDTLHLIKGICQSEILPGKDQTQVVMTKEEIGFMLSEKINNILNKVDADISTWEHVLDIVEEKRWGECVVIKRDIIDEKQQIKIVQFISEDKIKIMNETINDTIIGG